MISYFACDNNKENLVIYNFLFGLLKYLLSGSIIAYSAVVVLQEIRIFARLTCNYTARP